MAAGRLRLPGKALRAAPTAGGGRQGAEDPRAGAGEPPAEAAAGSRRRRRADDLRRLAAGRGAARADAARPRAPAAEVLVHRRARDRHPKVAEVIHLLSGAAARPFRKRAAAGADARGAGAAFGAAEGGTMFLDEVAALAPAAQFALLDLLESGPGARVIAGTYRDLGAEVGGGRFHADLYWRLDLLRVRIPALRERPEDIPRAVPPLRRQACEQAGLPEPEITPEVIARLMAQDWPGNARALMNAAMRFAMGLPERGAAAEEGGPGRADGAGGALAAGRGAAPRGRPRQPRGAGAEAAAQDLLRQARPPRASARRLPVERPGLRLCGFSRSECSYLYGRPHGVIARRSSVT